MLAASVNVCILKLAGKVDENSNARRVRQILFQNGLEAVNGCLAGYRAGTQKRDDDIGTKEPHADLYEYDLPKGKNNDEEQGDGRQIFPTQCHQLIYTQARVGPPDPHLNTNKE